MFIIAAALCLYGVNFDKPDYFNWGLFLGFLSVVIFIISNRNRSR
jgi:hypothetical protein